ncbi:hypothetical protein [Aurantiacibacter sp. MUD61]|uniref:hypothetical protein n=1 Tax=Aurantiacibacter sp. MUD61 TaxID=3009083 RepID=UPI0022F11713|nr:hypothetical protein [Aurantiacibacter sp. MUD61]
MQELTMEQSRPDQDHIQQATIESLGKAVGEDQAREFVAKMASESTPAPIGATASLKLAIWGKISCEPDGKPYKFDQTVWGGPAYFCTSAGFLYTAYDSWDAFFSLTTSFHAQGIASGGGFLQINWFNKDAVPIGQFNGASGGAGVAEAGGKGGWSHT